ncbi:6-phosphogluconolactonase [Zychaea mexicana]|uniref:6-phosphogluconolactonase n=1 Tax=Zychaea mexicana TaxID=64656 RepID=UPI0022FE3E8D|nr:6-phosphogluconolactonase [Zychaea mexicana]KAI9484951.1 6-phosphogluconolactonase [Zychaea mexicana]
MSHTYTFPTTDALSSGLNDFVAKRSIEAIADHGAFTVAVSGGSLPKLLSKDLRENPEVDFSKWEIFWADERCVPLDDADSNYRELKIHLLDAVHGQPKTHAIGNFGKDAEKAAVDYEQRLKDYFKGLPAFDLILLGMGPDGHCCSLFPGHPLLNETTRWVAPITDSPKPPPERITLTYPVVNHAKAVAFVTAGEGKQDMLQKILEQPQLQLPCQRVQPQGPVYWFVDEAAAGKLQKQTVSKY